MNYALALVIIMVALEDIQDTLAHHGGGIFAGWWYAENRWREKYRNPDGPYGFADRKWWAKLGLVAFLDLWHAAKTVRLWIVCGLIAYACGLAWWWAAVLWVIYGGLHDHVFYGKLYK